MKKILAIVSSILVLGATSAYAADMTNAGGVAVVNIQQLFQQSPKIASLNKDIQSKFKGRQDKLIAQQNALQAELDKYKKESPTMSAKDKDLMQKKISDDQSAFAKDAAQFQQDLSKEQNRIMKDVMAQLNTIVTGIAKKNNYSLVIDAQTVMYATDSADITKQVISQFDGNK